MADKTFNDVKINLTLKPQSERANVSSNKEDLAVQIGKIQQWYSGLNNYSTCATAAATAIKTVDCPGFELTTGTVVIVKFTVTNTAAVADLQLNVNGTGAKGIKYRNANLSAASVLTANRIYAMLYDGTYWQIIGDLDTNSNTYDRTSVQTRIYAGAKGVFPYSLCAMDTAQRMQAFTTTGGTGTSKAFNSSEKFLYPPVIMYHSANSTIANGSVIANNVLYEQYPSVNMQYNANVTTSSAYSQYKPLYIECTFDSNGYWSPTGIAQTFTSGKYYILLGCMYNTSIYQLALFAQHPLYYYDGTNLIDGELHLQDGRYLPMAGGTMDDRAEITIPNGSHSSQYTGFGMYHYIGAGNGWARGINVNSATDGTRIGSLGMYGNANATEPTYAYFGKTYDDAWYQLYKSIFRINDDEENGFQFKYKPSSLSSSYGASFITLFPGDTYGYGIVLGHSHGGMTIVGSGESASGFTDTAFDSTTSPYGSTVFQFDSEELVLTADNSIWFVSGANGLSTSAHTDWTNLKTALFDSSGNFRPSVDNKGSIGTSSYKWASIYGTTIYENGTSLASKYAAIGHTHSSLNVGNVGGKGIPIYFSSGTPTACSVPASGAWWNTSNALVSQISTSGVLEIGRYIDLHATAASTNNYDIRLDASTTNMVTLNSASGSTTFRIAGTLPMLRFQQTTSGKAFDNTSCGIWCRPADTNGVNMFMQSGGCIMIGAGEFASSAYSRKDSTGENQVGYDNIDNSTAERLYLGADGEVHIISNGQNIATYTNNDHNVWKFKTDGNLTTPGSITLPDTAGSIIKPQMSSGDDSTAFIHDTRSNSNYVRTIRWTKNGDTFGTYGASIGFHNTGGLQDDPGSIILVPYATDTSPWGGNVGLYIGKNILKLDGVSVALQNADSLNTMINSLSTGSSTPIDADYYVSQYVGGGTSTTTYHRRPMSALWSYVKGKADSVYAPISHTHNYAASATAGGTAKASESLKFTHGNELNVSKLDSNYHHCWLGYRFNTDGTEEIGDDTYYIDEWWFGTGKGGNYGKARIYPSAIRIDQILIQTGDTSASTYTSVHISLQTLMTWLITKKYIHTTTSGSRTAGVNEHVILTTKFEYATNDILQFTLNGTNYELQLAGVIIEFIGTAAAYNSGTYILKITSSPKSSSYTVASGYTKFPDSQTAIYHFYQNSSYSPGWSMNASTKPSITNTNPSSSTKHYLTFSTVVGGASLLCANNGLYYNTKQGTASATGLSELVIGNSTASGTAGNKQGNLTIYGTGSYYVQMRPNALSANRTLSLPDETGEVMIRSTANSGNQPVLYASSVNYSTNPLDIEVTNIFTQWKVVYVVLERLIYGTGSETAVSFQFLIPLQRVKALGTSPSNPYRIRVPYSNKNTLGEAYIDIKYVNANKFTATYSLGQSAGGVGIWTIYGIY